MFDGILFIEGFILGGAFMGLFTLALYLQLKDIAKAIRNPKDNPSRNILGQVKKAQIVRQKDNVDDLFGL